MEKSEVKAKIAAIIEKVLKMKAGSINDSTVLNALGADSIAVSNVIAEIEEEFDCVLRMDEMIKVKTLDQFAERVLNA